MNGKLFHVFVGGSLVLIGAVNLGVPIEIFAAFLITFGLFFIAYGFMYHDKQN